LKQENLLASDLLKDIQTKIRIKNAFQLHNPGQLQMRGRAYATLTLLILALLLPLNLRCEEAAGAGNSRTADPIVEVIVDPKSIQLSGRSDRFGILVHGKTASGDFVDLTRTAHFSSKTPELVSVTKGRVKALADGKGFVEVEAAGFKHEVEILVRETSAPRRFNFEDNITPLLSRFGCNSSGCHGKAEGQNGFKLSVFGYDPQADYKALVVESRGRRISAAAPDQSLLLLKLAGTMPHGGGPRIHAGTPEFETMRDWIAAGVPFGSAQDPKIEGIEITPRERILSTGSQQQLRVVASYSNGRKVDVTHLAQFQSNNESLARVDDDGLITVAEVPGQAAVMARYMGTVAVFPVLIPRTERITDYPKLAEHNFIDRLVHQKLRKLNIRPSDLSADAEFLRRIYLDLIGTLPTAAEARRFLSDVRPDRRARLVDELLKRPEYADYWALKWADLLRVDRQILGHKDAYAYYKWIRDEISANRPFNQTVGELLTAEGPLAEAPQGQFYKIFQKPGDMASTLSQVFLGVRIACAECHHHPFDRWGQSDYYGMQAFFQPVSRKKGSRGDVLQVEGNPETKNPRTGEKVYAHALGTKMSSEKIEGDPRRLLAEWFTSPQNPWFARNLANRLAAHFFGRGLVEPVDDVRATNPASNPELLEALAAHVVETKFDIQQVIRSITASRTYQLSSHPNETNQRDEQNYSRALFKRLPAEVLLDAICQTTGIGEKFGGVPSGFRAIQLWDSDVSHYFLKLFGRPVRKTACECERNAEASIAQVLHLMNSPEIFGKLSHESGAVAKIEKAIPQDSALIEELYLNCFNRFPTDDERRIGENYLRAGSLNRRAAAEDLQWRMLYSLEFIFNH
jgi:hypothetical protein